MPQDPQPNRPDGTTVVDDIVVTGTRTFQGYKVLPPFPPEVIYDGPVDPDAPEAPDQPGDLDEDCKRQATLNRAALEAAALVGSDGRESGFLLVRETDGSVRAIGPILGSEPDRVDWFGNPSAYGLSDFSNVVGLVHNHPRNRSAPGVDADRRRFSQEDAEVTAFFLDAGVSSDFRQYVVVNDDAWVFENDAREGDLGSTVESVQCPGAYVP